MSRKEKDVTEKGKRCESEGLEHPSHASHFTRLLSTFSYHDQTRGEKICKASQNYQKSKLSELLKDVIPSYFAKTAKWN